MDAQKVLGPKPQQQGGHANSAEAPKGKAKAKAKGKGGKDESKGKRGRSSEPTTRGGAKAGAHTVADADGWSEPVRSVSSIRRSKKKEARALALESGTESAGAKGGGKPRGGSPAPGGKAGKGGKDARPKNRICYYFNQPDCCHKTDAECSYLHKKGSKKELEEMNQAKAAGKGTAKGKSPKPAAGAAAAVEEMPDVCPLGDDCHDAACWRIRYHDNSAYVANEGPVFTYAERYTPHAPGNLARDN